jgi:Holliday junction DNA helicase RuvB
MSDAATHPNPAADPALRPKQLADFARQPQATEALQMAISGVISGAETLDDTLFFGPPGLGKTTLAGIVAAELGSGFRVVAAPSIQRAGDLASVLVSITAGSVLFIDEIH